MLILSGGPNRACSLALSVIPPTRNASLPRMAPRRQTRGGHHVTRRSSVHGTCITAFIARRRKITFTHGCTVSTRSMSHLLITSEKGRRALASFLSITTGRGGTRLTLDLLELISSGSLHSMAPRILRSRFHRSITKCYKRCCCSSVLGPQVTGRVLAPCGRFFRGTISTGRIRRCQGGPRTLMT